VTQQVDLSFGDLGLRGQPDASGTRGGRESRARSQGLD